MLDSPVLKPFVAHGVAFTGHRGVEAFGTCPFTGKAEKFYVNTKTGLWDSKTAGVSGNLSKFLELIHEVYREALTSRRLEALAKNRQLPPEAFEAWDLGWDGRQYTLPVRNINNQMTDIRTYRLGGRVISTAGVKTGIFGAHALPTRQNEPVYLCEGEWDAIALAWLLEELDRPGVVVGLPGATTFKPEWVSWFNRRTVHTLYDHDAPGRQGELKAEQRLGSAAKLTFVHWPQDLPDGFDVRDWIVYGAVERRTPKQCFKKLTQLFRPISREADQQQADRRTGQDRRRVRLVNDTTPDGPPPTLDDVHAAFKRWLFLENTDAIDVTLAVAVSQRIGGSPVWLFLVGPPGSAKTVMVSSLDEYSNVFMTSSLTPHALISGSNFQGGNDPSLIPRLDGKVLVVKDFTAILSMRDTDKDEIFGYLRDAYDGRCGKVFGNGVERNYKSRFTLVGAVTPKIYDVGESHQALGERFLKFTLADNMYHAREDEIIDRAIANIDRESVMHKELATVVADFLHRRVPQDLEAVPTISEDFSVRIRELGKFGARMRGTVTRHAFHSDLMTARPSAEVGTRLSIQLAKLAQSLALVRGRMDVNDDDYRIVKKAMLDTISQRNEDVLRHLLKACPKPTDFISTKEVAAVSRYPVATVQRLLQDLHVLDIVQRQGSGYKHVWSPSTYIRERIRLARIYDTPEERNRPTRLWVSLRRPAGKKAGKKLSLRRGEAGKAPGEGGNV